MWKSLDKVFEAIPISIVGADQIYD